MTTKEAYRAMIERVPVTCDGIQYNRIAAIKYTLTRNDDVICVAELIDKSNCLVVVKVESVKAVEK